MARVLSIFFQRLPYKYREKAGLTRLLKWAYHFSPIVALDQAPSRMYEKDPRFCGFNLDISGNARLFEGEHALLARILSELSDQDIDARASIAPTLGAAWALSRYAQAKSTIVHTHNMQTELATLPLEALRLEKQTLVALRELNIRSLGQVLAIPKNALKSRFPQELVCKLHQLLGTIQEPLKAIRFTPLLSSTRSIGDKQQGGVSELAALAQHCKALLEDILQQCDEAHCLVTELILHLSFCTAPTLHRRCSTTLPSNSFPHLWALVHHALETSPIELGVCELRLSCPYQETIDAVHSSFIADEATQQQSKEFARLLDSLYQRLGTQRVLRLEIRESHIPERSFSYLPLKDTCSPDSNSAQLVQTERPSILYPEPKAIRAMAVVPDTPPFWLLWNGHTHHIRNSIGPERISPEWWSSDGLLCESRDYFRVQLEDGLWLWIFRTVRENSWFLHGIWA